MQAAYNSALVAQGAFSAYWTDDLVAVGVPERMGQFLRQRSRWARGMFEGLRTHPPHTQPRVLAKVVAGVDYLVPLVDVGLVFSWVPGVILFLFGYPLIVGWWSMLLFPMTLVIFALLRRWQERHVFGRWGIHPAHDRRGFVAYMLVYPVLNAVAPLRGYAEYVGSSGRRWE
jgi:poly-beta-1,6-N-acetyl-D-glucosamine synthase